MVKLNQTNLKLALPFLQHAPDKFIEDLINHSSPMNFEKGQQLMQEHDKCSYLPVVLSGRIKVYRVSTNAKELTLYYIESGETCFLSANCIFLEAEFPAAARAEEYTETLMVQASAMARWLDEYSFWQKYVFQMAAKRLISVISSISDMTFAPLDVRIARFLSRQLNKQGDNEILATHQDIASELGSAREVVTRILKGFENEGYLKLARGRILVKDPQPIHQLAMTD